VTSTSPPSDLVVVGAGVVGMATALAARDRGARVVVLDDGVPGGAGSAGPGRIFRHIHARPDLVRLAIRSRLAWEVLSERLGRPLVDGRGALLVGEGTDEAAGLLAEGGVAHERLAADALPGPLAPVGPGLLDPGGGTIDAAGAVAGLAAALGPAIRRARVEGLRAGAGSATALTDDGPVSAGRVLACPGARAGALAADRGADLQMLVRRHLRVAFRVPGAGALPCLLERSGAHAPGVTGYGTTLPGGLVALGTHAADDRPEADAIAITRAWAAAALPGLDPEPAGLLACDSVQLGDDPDAFALVEDGAAAVFAGGNLFKHAPALGPLLAEAILEGRRDPVLASRTPAGSGGRPAATPAP
jgi:sarcosine oxidase